MIAFRKTPRKDADKAPLRTLFATIWEGYAEDMTEALRSITVHSKQGVITREECNAAEPAGELSSSDAA